MGRRKIPYRKEVKEKARKFLKNRRIKPLRWGENGYDDIEVFVELPNGEKRWIYVDLGRNRLNIDTYPQYAWLKDYIKKDDRYEES